MVEIKNIEKPLITLIGAGPGDPDLISVKAIKALKNAKVVLYDALVDESLLDYCPSNCIKVFVGKKKGVCQTPQNQINELLVEYALKYKHVIRLKGGDSFIFGRGHEEMIYTQNHGIDVDIIPGISSFYAAPELISIPLTRRDISESFWVITGTTKNHELSKDISQAAKSNATVVILMGMTHLADIVAIFMNENKAKTPIAIIQNASLATQKVCISTIEQIIIEKEKANISSPAVIIIGNVVKSQNPSTLLNKIIY